MWLEGATLESLSTNSPPMKVSLECHHCTIFSEKVPRFLDEALPDLGLVMSVKEFFFCNIK